MSSVASWSTPMALTQLFTGAGIALTPRTLISLVVPMQVLNGLITSVLLTFVPIVAHRRAVLGAAANARVLRLVATVCVGAIGALALAAVAITVFGSG
jgi:Mn2+/Fe2+ NRAMP family transporter